MRQNSHRTLVRLGAVLGLMALAVALGCGSVARPTSVPPTVPGRQGPGKYRSGPRPLDTLTFSLTPVARGFNNPVLVTNAGDGSGRLFVVEQGGLVRVVRRGRISKGYFLDVRRSITAGGERGLLGLAFAPDYETSGRFYVDYTDLNGDTVVARYVTGDPTSDTPVLEGPKTVLHVTQPYSNHNGGNLVFGPDGLLWVGMGDGGSAGDPHGNAQNPRSLLGKMLTIDVASANPKPVRVVMGVRNPWRYSFDRRTGDLWIGDVGQDSWEEIDVLRVGAISGVNLGWNLWEGDHPYPKGGSPSKTGFTFPVAEYGHDVGHSVTGGFVYRGSKYPRMGGAYLYADFESGWIAALRLDSNTGTPKVSEQQVVLRDTGMVSSFGEDEAGEMYVCDWGGGTVYAVSAR